LCPEGLLLQAANKKANQQKRAHGHNLKSTFI
jgi:hypothetical protein